MDVFFSAGGVFKRIPVVLIICAIIYSLALPSVFAGSQAISQAEEQLNVKGFGAGDAFSFGFDDAVNLYNGNLIIRATDVYLPGRNGLDVKVTRQYDSNIWLHWNQCGGPDNGWGISMLPRTSPVCEKNIVCPDCMPPFSPNWDGCCQYYDEEVTSMERPTWLGRGWEMDMGRVKDPTQLFRNWYEESMGVPDYYDYRYGVPEKGTNEISIVLDNTERSVIFPKFFRLPDNNLDYTFFAWSSDLFDDDPTDNIYTAYTDDLSPLTLFHYDVSWQPSEYAGIPIWARYRDKNGNTYYFNHYVQFCGFFDDIPYSDQAPLLPGECIYQHITQQYQGQPTYRYYKWAENPYAGIYLTGIMDPLGNYIHIDYWGSNLNIIPEDYMYLVPDIDPDDYTQNVPYIWKITDTLGRVTEFCTDDPDKISYTGADPNLYSDCYFNTVEPDAINKRLKRIKYPDHNGNNIYVFYHYSDRYNNELLTKVEVMTCPSGQSSCDLHKTTKYEYYTETTPYPKPYHMLKNITYSTGAIVEYEYNLAYVFTYNYFFPSLPITGIYNPNMIQHWVVSKRTVYPSPEDYPNNGLSWHFIYDFTSEVTDNSRGVVISKTTVIDPDGNKEEHYFFPATVAPASIYDDEMVGPGPMACEQIFLHEQWRCLAGPVGG